MSSIKRLFFLIVLTAGFLVSTESMWGQFDYVGRYRAQALNISVNDGHIQEEIRLLRIEDKEIVYRRLNQREGEIARPIADIKNFIFIVPKSFEDGLAKLRQGDTEGGLAGMRPFVYSLFPYQQLPSTNLFAVLETYLSYLTQFDQVSEAVYFVRNLDLKYATPEFLNTALQFTQKLISENRRTDAVAILNRLPFDQDNIDLLKVVYDYANDLRRRGSFTEANFLYNRLINVEDHPYRVWSILWHVYGDVSLNRFTAAKLFINQYLPKAPEPSEPTFALYQMIIGKMHWLQEEKQEAIMEITRGVVFTPLDSEWTSELFYINGQCYEGIGKSMTAREIYNTIRIFYPNSPWAIKAQERIEVISPGFLEMQSQDNGSNASEAETEADAEI